MRLPRTLTAALLCGLAGGPLAVHAQAQPAGSVAVAPQPVFVVRGFQVTGDNPLDQGETARVLAPYLRTQATIDTLQEATSALEKSLRDRGFSLYRVTLPPQELGDGMVTLRILRFTVGQIAVQGNTRSDEANARRSLPELREGGTPDLRKLAVQTALANENPNRQVQVGLRESQQADQVDATITVRDTQPWNLAIALSNAGTRATGRDRLTVSGGHSNLFNLDHQFVGAYTTSLQKPSDVRQLGLSYRAPLYALGGMVGASATRSDVVGDFGAFTSTGAGHTLGVNYTQYLPPRGGRRSHVRVGLDDKVFDAARINDILVPGQRDRRSRPFSVGYGVRSESDTRLWAYDVEFLANTSGGSGNTLAAYQSEDPRISTTRWRALRGGASYTGSLPAGWLLGVRGQYQYSPDVLIAGEQFGLGGQSSVRGTVQERPIAGDKGVALTVEVTSAPLLPGLRVLAFTDAGWLSNNSATAGRPASDAIGSAGLGLRYSAGALQLGADYGRLLRGSRVPLALNAASPQRGDDRLYINVSVRF